MILSNEPGYYKTGEYGIRIENLVQVVDKVIPGAEKEMLGFETLTFAPIDRRLVARDMLAPAERDWLNAYHADVLAKIGAQLSGDDRAWLEAACAPV
jgi:Xaa-Pro aminopeptidase